MHGWLDISLLSWLKDSFFVNSNSPKSYLISLRTFFLKNHKHLCNALGLYDMYVSLLSLKYRPPSMMLHHHRVPLFTIQSVLSFCDSPALSWSDLAYSFVYHQKVFVIDIALTDFTNSSFDFSRRLIWILFIFLTKVHCIALDYSTFQGWLRSVDVFFLFENFLLF